MIPIINSPTVPFETIRSAAIKATASISAVASVWYLNMIRAAWTVGIREGVDPTVLAARCAHETGWGKFSGAVTPQHNNPAGLKTRVATGDTPNDHVRFTTIEVGVTAQAHHLKLYAGFTVPDDTPDQRSVFVSPMNTAFGSARFVEDLGTRWAPSPEYGLKVAAVHRLLKAG